MPLWLGWNTGVHSQLRGPNRANASLLIAVLPWGYMRQELTRAPRKAWFWGPWAVLPACRDFQNLEAGLVIRLSRRLRLGSGIWPTTMTTASIKMAMLGVEKEKQMVLLAVVAEVVNALSDFESMSRCA